VAIENETITVLTGPSAGTFTIGGSNAIQIACQPFFQPTTTLQTPPGDPGETYSYTISCGRQWTAAQQFSPAGIRYAMRTRHAVQPFVIGTAGYMYSSRPIPIANAGSFNYTFDFGVGVEIFRSRSRSISVETRYHHFANGSRGGVIDPGVDNVM
jgi:hypothetical protein